MTSDERIAELQRQIDELKAAQAQPKSVGWIEPRPMARDFSLLDRTAGASMPPSALAALVDGVDAQVMAGLRGDVLRRSPSSGPVSVAVAPAPRPTPEPVKGTGWVDAAPISQPPGIGLIDKIAEAFAGPAHGPKPKAEPEATKPKEER